MKRAGDYPIVTCKEGVQTYGTFTHIAPPLDKPAALLALIEYAKLGIECYGQAVAAIEKLSAAIISEVNELEK
jgi:hypothetical protein